MRLTLSFLVIFTGAVFAQFINPTPWTGATATNWTGTGTEASPYLITTAEQLAGIAKAVQDGNTFEGKHIKLDNNISLSDPSVPAEKRPKWTPIGEERWITPPGGSAWDWVVTFTPFKGTFDGGGYTVSNVFFDSIPDNSDWFNLESWLFDFAGFDFSGICKGFFGYVEGATIKNVKLEKVSVAGDKEVGGLVANNKGGHIINSSVVGGSVVGGDAFGVYGAGGLVGVNEGGTIENSFADVSVTSPERIGGLVGKNIEGGTIKNSYAKGNVLADAMMATDQWGNPVKGSSGLAGGLVGENRGLIEDSYATGDVRSIYSNEYYSTTAGFAARNHGTIIRSYATGDVYNDSYYGGAGFVGFNGSDMMGGDIDAAAGTIIDCYATGKVHGRLGAGFVRQNTAGFWYFDKDYSYSGLPGTIINSFSTGEVVEVVTGKGFSGESINGTMRRTRFANGVINSYYNSDNTSVTDNAFFILNNIPRTTAQMQSQGFVDTLNMVAALMGTGKWEYVPGGNYPKPTKIIANNITDYLGGGSGSASDPYIISTKKHLENFAFYVNTGFDFKNKHVKLAADIELNLPNWEVNAPTRWTPIGHASIGSSFSNNSSYQRAFSGTFDGDGHEISGLYVDSGDDYQGLFGVVYDGTIKNLGVVDAWVKGRELVGILAGMVHSDWRRGSSTISDCWTTGEVDALNLAGGLVGMTFANENGKAAILNSYSKADVKISGIRLYGAGGLTGQFTTDNLVSFAKVENSYSAGNSMGVLLREIFRVHIINGFYDGEKAKPFDVATHLDRGTPLATAEMQSKEFVNILNYWVTTANEQGAEQHWYWQHNEGDYPSLTLTVPPHSVAYNSNGGSSVVTQKVLDASKTNPPPAPEKADNTFAGWFSDEELTTPFDFATEKITGNITLYARWLGKPAEADTTWYTNNKFATTYHITTAQQLAGLSLITNGSPKNSTFNFAGKTIILDNNIALNDTTNWQQWGKAAHANPWTPIGTFNGTFNGNGKVISGIYVNSASGSQGLFSNIGISGRVEKLGIEASFIGSVGHNIGALAGNNNGAIENCYSTGNVKGANFIGGLVGLNFGTISKSYAAGKVSGTGSSVGGLAGYANVITNSYYDMEVSGQSDNKGVPKTTARMKQKATYEDWDFDDIWGRNNSVNNGYPYLRGSISETLENDEDALLATSTVVFNSNEGSHVESQTGITGELIATLPSPAPTRDGYAFEGWYSDEEFTVAFNFATVIDEDIMLHAKWREIISNITLPYVNNITTASDVSDWTLTSATWNSSNNGQLVFQNEGATAELPVLPAGLTNLRITVSARYGDYIYLHTSRDGVTFTNQGLFTGSINVATATKTIPNGTRFVRLVASKGTINDVYLISVKITDNVYDVDFSSNGGSAVAAAAVEMGSTVSKPANPTRTNHSFKGWYSDIELTEEYDFETPVTESIKLYAKWLVRHQITIKLNGGLLNGSSTSGFSLEDGSTIIGSLINSPTRAGYAFKGWYLNELFTIEYEPAPVTEEFTLYAKWVQLRTISWSINGTVVAVDYVENGTIPEYKGETPTRESTVSLVYTFTGWSPAITAATANRTYTAQFSSVTRTYAVEFNSNGGSEVSSQTVNYNTRATAPANPAKNDHGFRGWYLDEALTTAFNFNTYITADVTLYAKWEEVVTYATTFNSNGGSSVPTQYIEQGTKATAPVSPAKEGYRFAGWYSNEALTTAFNFNTNITANITLYAKWEPVLYANNISTADDASDLILERVTWGSANNGQLIFQNAGASIELPALLPNTIDLSITISARYGNYIYLHTSPDGVTFTNQGLFTGSSSIATATKTMPNGTRYVKLVANTGTVNDVYLISVYITGNYGEAPSSSSVTTPSSSSVTPSSSSSEDAPSSSSVDTPNSSSSEDAPSSSSVDTPNSSSSVETDNYPSSSSSSEGIQTTPSSSSVTPSSSSNGIVTPTQLPQIAQSNQATQIYNGINLHATHNATIDVYALNGRGVSQYTLAGGVHNVSLGHLPKGVYIVKVSFGSEKRMLRVPVR